jgi:hypothetical protein
MERWKPVVGFEDYYEVSDLGRVRSLARTCRNSVGTYQLKPRILKPRPDGRSKGGIGHHVAVCLAVDGNTTQRQVHVLVLEAFVGPRPMKHETRHLNGIPNDNRLSNLTWGTAAENRADTLRHGTHLRGSCKANAKLHEIDIPLIRAANAAGASHYELARQYGVRRGTIQQIFRGKTWSHVS